ncbi:RagB/SusD family nutrient uptake outer membrane protein [Haliscomenobacter sp.]|uniref:RagB/SusD family nutrient uptake outer membrane protein n=1 Tax=Haliscomenobacter sp. TaxID=2717303 RepID=UPI0035947865
MKKLLFNSVFIFLILGFSACGEDFFDDAMQQSNSASDTWGSTNDLERLVAGAYYGISGYAGFRGLHGLQGVHEAFMSDLGYLHTNGATGDWEQDVYNRKNNRNDISNYSSTWSGGYQAVALCNEVIGWVEKNGPFKDQYGPLWTDRLVGESLFLRAWVYFQLVRMHAPAYGANNSAPSIILNTKPSKEPFANPGRATVQQVYDQMLADLTEATRLLPETYDSKRDPLEYQDRANRDAARFLMAQVHFQMKNYAKAKEQIDLLIAPNRYPLSEDPIETWNKSGLGAKGKEVVWQYVQFSTSQQQWKGSPAGAFFGFTTRGNSSQINSGRILSASDAFLNAAGWNADQLNITNLPAARPPGTLGTQANFTINHPDKRLAQLWRAIPAGYDPRTEFTGYTRTYVWCNKWNRLSGSTNNNLFSLPLMRIAELYLNRAIIRFNEGDRKGAAEDLNVVRKRAGLDPVAEADLTANLIHIERMKELAFENDRLYYLQALSLPIPAGDRADQTPIPWNDTRFAMPIPASESDLNPGVR